MMYYIEQPQTWRAANRKCAEMQEHVSKFRNCLVVDELSRDALVNELRCKTDELNNAYPRTKKLVTTFDFGNCVSCRPEGDLEGLVFTLHFCPVCRTFRFAENAFALEKGGRP